MKRRGSKCTNQRLTIWSACFLRGHLNLLNLWSYFVIGLLCRAKWMSQLGTSLTWDQAQFSFRFVNNIPAGKAKRNDSLLKAFYEMSTAHFGISFHNLAPSLEKEFFWISRFDFFYTKVLRCRRASAIWMLLYMLIIITLQRKTYEKDTFKTLRRKRKRFEM